MSIIIDSIAYTPIQSHRSGLYKPSYTWNDTKRFAYKRIRCSFIIHI